MNVIFFLGNRDKNNTNVTLPQTQTTHTTERCFEEEEMENVTNKICFSSYSVATFNSSLLEKYPRPDVFCLVTIEEQIAENVTFPGM